VCVCVCVVGVGNYTAVSVSIFGTACIGCIVSIQQQTRCCRFAAVGPSWAGNIDKLL